jgi:hypothetical protein
VTGAAERAVERVRQVAWGSAVIGGLLGLAVVLLFVLVVAEPMVAVLSGMGPAMVFGVMILVVGLLRVVAGTWTAQLVRRRYEVRRRSEFLPTALAAGAIGWALYTILVLVAGGVMGTTTNTVQLIADVLQWLAEFGLGAFLVSPEERRPDVAARGRTVR